MKRTALLALGVTTAILASASAFASDDAHCTAPMSEWQPRENLQQKLEAEGWKVKRIKTEDGCYEAYAFDKNGHRVEAYFDPKTLAQLGKKSDD